MDFPSSEYEARLERAQRAMDDADLDALFIMSEAELRWFTGFRTLFWQSPTRPWYLVVPATGKPIAIIPAIGAPLMEKTWIEDIRSWSAPDREDDGLSLLKAAISPYGRIGMAMGHETALRMPLVDFDQLRTSGGEWVDATALIQKLRMVKSETEIALHAKICTIASNAFDRADQLFYIGQPLDDAFRDFKIELLKQGADDVPYLVGGKGRDGYLDVISPPGPAALEEGDVLMLDTGSTLNGAFCDFDRNFAFGHASDQVQRTHSILWDATEAGLNAARPGARASDIFKAMAAVMEAKSGLLENSNVGRFGHGLGMQLTEQPSIIDWDHTIMEPGMVMTLEPSLDVPGGGMLVHEENIVIREGPPQLLTRRETREIKVI